MPHNVTMRAGDAETARVGEVHDAEKPFGCDAGNGGWKYANVLEHLFARQTLASADSSAQSGQVGLLVGALDVRGARAGAHPRVAASEAIAEEQHHVSHGGIISTVN